MVKKKPGLGRGLDVLLSAAATPASNKKQAESDENSLQIIPVHKIQRGEYQPRIHIDQEALEELAASIRAQGLVQPVVVRPIGDMFELIAGERRWRASQLAELHDIPAVVKEIPDQAAAAMSLIENIQREDLNPLEESQALHRLIEEFGLTHQQVGDAVGRSRTAVSNLLRLLDLSPAVLKYLETRDLEMGHARALLPLDDSLQLKAASHVIEKKLSVRETEKYVKTLLAPVKKTEKTTARSPDVMRLEQDLGDKIGAPVQLKYNNKGQGKLIISYNNLDELDGILEHIK